MCRCTGKQIFYECVVNKCFFFIASASGQIEVIVASDKEVKISPVREAFHNIFGSGQTSIK